jgi:hypothetical protein
VARANAVRHPRVFQRFSLTEIAGLALIEAPRTNDLHRWTCNIAIGVPSDARNPDPPQMTDNPEWCGSRSCRRGVSARSRATPRNPRTGRSYRVEFAFHGFMPVGGRARALVMFTPAAMEGFREGEPPLRLRQGLSTRRSSNCCDAVDRTISPGTHGVTHDHQGSRATSPAEVAPAPRCSSRPRPQPSLILLDLEPAPAQDASGSAGHREARCGLFSRLVRVVLGV